MQLYERLWRVGATALGVLGVAVLLTSQPVGSVVAIALFAGLAGYTAQHLLVDQGDPGSRSARRYAVTVAGSAATGMGVAGLLVLAGPAGLALLLLVAASSPPALRWCARLAGAHRPSPGPEPLPTEDDGAVAVRTVWHAPAADSLTDEQLCRAWRTSFTALQRVRRADDLAALADARADYLDELERRHPAQFARWIGNGARAASDPGRYLGAAADPSRRHPS